MERANWLDIDNKQGGRWSQAWKKTRKIFRLREIISLLLDINYEVPLIQFINEYFLKIYRTTPLDDKFKYNQRGVPAWSSGLSF